MPAKTPIYLDHNATTPLDPRVLEAMMPYLTVHYGNAASRSHAFGWKADEAVSTAREQTAALIGAGPKDIIWTSGATESNNLAIKGVAEMHGRRGGHVVTCLAEHKAVLDPCAWLAQNGFEITYLEPDGEGRVSAEQVADALTDRTILITLMAANNEIGTLHPVAEIGRLAKNRGVLFHCDATQAVGRVPVDVEAMGIDLLSLSAHKIYGPKGVGCLYVRRRGPRVRLAGQMHGGGHERGLRSGTLNVAGTVGLGAAAEIAARVMPHEAPRVRALRDRLEGALLGRLDAARRNGHATERLPNTANLSFAYIEGESLMMKMPDVAVSSASACTSASLEASHVLRAIGLSEELAHGSIRFSLGRSTTEAEIDYVVERVASAVAELRDMSPLYEMAMEEARRAGAGGEEAVARGAGQG